LFYQSPPLRAQLPERGLSQSAAFRPARGCKSLAVVAHPGLSFHVLIRLPRDLAGGDLFSHFVGIQVSNFLRWLGVVALNL